MEENPQKRGDLWSGGVLAVLGGYIIAEARRWDYLTPEGPGAGFFPLWYGIAILVLSLALVWGASRSAGTGRGGVEWRKTGRALAVWVALAVAVAAFKLLGFVLSFALLIFFLVAVMYRRPAGVAAAVAVAVAAGFYLVFPFALDVSLPVGVFGF
jgi:putative tricarboxylic transport membrane protein